MEGREGMNNSGVTVVRSDAPSDYHIAPRTEAPTTGSTVVTTQVVLSPAPPSTAVPPPLGVMPLSMKKKRGRPRKYGPDGSVTQALSPKPISSAGSSPVIDFSSGKRGKIRPPSAGKHHQHSSKIGLESLGDWFSCSVGANFIPHIINVNAGEDVTMKVISFSQQGPRAICILSANGVISSVTLRQPDSSGGTLTYEGRFEILSLAGSFMASESGGIRNRSGGMSVSLASPDGRVVGGSVAGLLVAASPVQCWAPLRMKGMMRRIVVGSFLTGNQHEQKTAKKPKAEAGPPPAVAIPTSGGGGGSGDTEEEEEEEAAAYGVKMKVSSAGAAVSSFRGGDNWYNNEKKASEMNMSGVVNK